jgi:hypothetical protein
MNPRPLTEDERNMVLEKLKHIGTKQTATVNTDFDPIDNIHKKPVQFSDLLPDSGINNRTVQRVLLLLVPYIYAKLKTTQDDIVSQFTLNGFEFISHDNGVIKFNIIDEMPLSTLHIFFTNNEITNFMFT